MEYELGFKELYDVAIKTTSNIGINGKTLEAGETIVAFDKIQIASFIEVRKVVTANGGFDNRPQVWWETTKDVSFKLNQGVFSKEQFAMMLNAQLFKIDSSSIFYINKRETLESDEDCYITPSKTPYDPMFIYDEDGNKCTYTIEDNKIKVPSALTNYIVDYYYAYDNGYKRIRIGEELTHSYFTLQGKTRVKDDITGQVKTGIIYIPKMKLVSDLSMQLGRNATPIMGTLDAVACPIGVKGNTTVMEMFFLNDDIDSDM